MDKDCDYLDGDRLGMSPHERNAPVAKGVI
jgi:hypothetical protein